MGIAVRLIGAILIICILFLLPTVIYRATSDSNHNKCLDSYGDESCCPSGANIRGIIQPYLTGKNLPHGISVEFDVNNQSGPYSFNNMGDGTLRCAQGWKPGQNANNLYCGWLNDQPAFLRVSVHPIDAQGNIGQSQYWNVGSMVLEGNGSKIISISCVGPYTT